MVSIMCAISKGLARYSNAPPSVAAMTVSMLPRPVIRITAQSGFCRRAVRSTSIPVRSSK